MLSYHNKHWRQVVNLMKNKRIYGCSLAVTCQKHFDMTLNIVRVEDFNGVNSFGMSFVDVFFLGRRWRGEGEGERGRRRRRWKVERREERNQEEKRGWEIGGDETNLFSLSVSSFG